MVKKVSAIKIVFIFTAISLSVAQNQIQKEPFYSEGVSDLKIIFDYYSKYQVLHDGRRMKDTSDLVSFIKSETSSYQEYADKIQVLTNEDAPSVGFFVPYKVYGQRIDGASLDAPHMKQTYDLLADTAIYSSDKFYGEQVFLALTDRGNVKVFSPDLVSFYINKNKAYRVYPNQAGVDGMNCTSYEEFFSGADLTGRLPQEKPMGKSSTDQKIVDDNGGPESLIQLSRRTSYISSDVIRRDVLWKRFDPLQPEFTLAEIQTGATKLGLNTQTVRQTLAQLQTSGTPALLFLPDDGRIVTLTALDDDRAVVIDRGLTQNIERAVLEKRYGGEALVPAKALTQNAAIVADDAVRELKLPSLDTEVPQQFTLRNTGDKPITLQLEYPLLGVTESKLSQDVIAPGETATLDLKVKWRSILQAPYQNVLVSIQTNDPIVPRLQLAVLLTPPAQAGQ